MTKFIKYTLDNIFCENSKYTGPLRLKVIKEKLLQYNCNNCGIDMWCEKNLSLQLDHINGISDDNRLENLRFLCPNCHSQTDTFAGRNIKKEKILKKEMDIILDYNPTISFRQQKNKIWKIPLEQLKNIVQSKNTLSDILKYFGFALKGAQYKALKERLFWENIKIEHISLGSNHNKNKRFNRVPIDLDKVLIEHSTYPRYLLKLRLLNEHFLENKCYICGQSPEWNTKILVLQLDHINGLSNDNRIENLRILCPNCHSQTSTYSGKKNEKFR